MDFVNSTVMRSSADEMSSRGTLRVGCPLHKVVFPMETNLLYYGDNLDIWVS
jgi:hypothetical protein